MVSLSPVTIEQFLSHAACSVNAQPRCLLAGGEWNTCLYEGAICHSGRDLLGTSLSVCRLSDLKDKANLAEASHYVPWQRAEGGKRNFMGRRLYRKWHFCVKGGFLEECPHWKESLWRMDWARLQSGVLSHKWKIRLRLLERISAAGRDTSQRRRGATWNVDFCIHMPLGVFASL